MTLMKARRCMELNALVKSRATSTQSGCSSKMQRTEWVVNSRPDAHATPTWAGHGEPSGWATGRDRSPGGGGWRKVAKRERYWCAATMETARPRVEPMAMGRSLRSAASASGRSPGLARAMRRPPRNQGRTDAGMAPENMAEQREYRASAPRPGTKAAGEPGGASGLTVERCL